MISLTKKSILDSVVAASLGAVCASPASVAQAGELYQISVFEDTFGPAGNIPYQNGIIRKYSTDPDGPANVPQFAGFQYSDAQHEVNGIDGNYKVLAEASNVHGGTAHASAFGDGGFSGYSNSVNGQGISAPQQGFTFASAHVGYNFRLIGPSSTTPISVTFDATAYVRTVGTGFGFADLNIASDFLRRWSIGSLRWREHPNLPRRDDLAFAEHALWRFRVGHRLRPRDIYGRSIRS